MNSVQSAQFRKAYKKLHPNQLPEMNQAIRAIIENPVIGEQKRGDLSWLRVHKFKMLGALTLIGYCISESGNSEDATLSFVAFGPHENFYRDLKRQQ